MNRWKTPLTNFPPKFTFLSCLSHYTVIDWGQSRSEVKGTLLHILGRIFFHDFGAVGFVSSAVEFVSCAMEFVSGAVGFVSSAVEFVSGS